MLSQPTCCWQRIPTSNFNPIDHLLGATYGWGGKTAFLLTVREVPVDGFWSITVYNAKGFIDGKWKFPQALPQ